MLDEWKYYILSAQVKFRYTHFRIAAGVVPSNVLYLKYASWEDACGVPLINNEMKCYIGGM